MHRNQRLLHFLPVCITEAVRATKRLDRIAVFTKLPPEDAGSDPNSATPALPDCVSAVRISGLLSRHFSHTIILFSILFFWKTFLPEHLMRSAIITKMFSITFASELPVVISAALSANLSQHYCSADNDPVCAGNHTCQICRIRHRWQSTLRTGGTPILNSRRSCCELAQLSFFSK